MTIITSSLVRRRSHRSHRTHAKILALILVATLLLGGCDSGQRSGGASTAEKVATALAVTLVGVLVGEAAEAGVLALTGSAIAARVASIVAGTALSYVLSEYSVKCRDCGTITTYRNQPATEGQPIPVGCSNPACSLHDHGAASLLVFSDTQKMNVALARINSQPPTCSLTKRLLANNNVLLIWNSRNASSALLNGDRVDPNGSRDISVGEATRYVLHVTDQYGNAAEAAITVDAIEGAPAVAASPSLESPQPPPATTPTPLKPVVILVPGDQVIYASLEGSLQTGQTQRGQEFYLRVSTPVIVQGRTAVPAGSKVAGRVLESVPAGRFPGGGAFLSLRFERLLIGNRQFNISAEGFSRQAPPGSGNEARKVGSGGGTSLPTKGPEILLPQGLGLEVRLIDPLRIELDQ